MRHAGTRSGNAGVEGVPMTRNLVGLAMTCAAFSLGCESRLGGDYAGEATESGTVKLTNAAGVTSTNETLPHVLDQQELSISQADGRLTVQFGSCKLQGEKTSGETGLVKGDCHVSVAGHSGTLPLSAMVTAEGRGVRAEIAGVAENPTAVVSYKYMFKGDRRRR
jgi:hypothetical protein